MTECVLPFTLIHKSVTNLLIWNSDNKYYHIYTSLYAGS